MTGSSNDPRALCECTRQGNAAAAPAKKGRGMAAFANLGGGGCQCNLTHHHQLIYEPILHHLDQFFKRFRVHPVETDRFALQVLLAARSDVPRTLVSPYWRAT